MAIIYSLSSRRAMLSEKLQCCRSERSNAVIPSEARNLALSIFHAAGGAYIAPTGVATYAPPAPKRNGTGNPLSLLPSKRRQRYQWAG